MTSIMVQIIHTGGGINLDLTDETSVNTLKDLIKSDTPVLIESRSHSTASMNLYPTLSRELFYSNGKVNSDLGIFPRTVNERSVVARASHASKDQNWGMAGYWLDESIRIEGSKVVKPYNGTQQHYNEGTFSPAGGVSWTTVYSGGTTRILIGKPVEDEFGRELRAINFVERGLSFDLPTFYSMPGYLIKQKGKNDAEERKLERDASELVCVSASRRLVEEAALKLNSRRRSKHGINTELTATQVGWWKAGCKMFVDNGYPIDDEDYALNELSHPGRLVGFVKVLKGGLYGRTFVYPTKVARETFELAFSDKFVEKHFPAERRK